jgi:hypothetical protein
VLWRAARSRRGSALTRALRLQDNGFLVAIFGAVWFLAVTLTEIKNSITKLETKMTEEFASLKAELRASSAGSTRAFRSISASEPRLSRLDTQPRALGAETRAQCPPFVLLQVAQSAHFLVQSAGTRKRESARARAHSRVLSAGLTPSRARLSSRLLRCCVAP